MSEQTLTQEICPGAATNVDLDKLMDLDEFSQFIGLNKTKITPHTKGRNPKIPAIWINERVVRFHPRTVLAKFAADAGVRMEIIAASYGASFSIPQPAV
jgi:hypothetical protein